MYVHPKDMENLDYIELLLTLESLRPDDYINMIGSSDAMKLKVTFLKYDLLKYWTGDKRSRSELEVYLPNLTFRQMQVLADFYYPTANSIGKYRYDHLFLNAIRAGYSDEDCLQFIKGEVNDFCAVSTLVHQRSDLLTAVANKGDRVANIILIEEVDNININVLVKAMLSHPDVTIEYFCDVMYKLALKNPDIKDAFAAKQDDEEYEFGSDIDLLADSGHSVVIALQKKLGVAPGNPNRIFDQNTIEEFPAVAIKCELYNREFADADQWIQYHESAVNALSRIDSVKFPTYDLNNDISSGNWLEVIHKVNTYDRNVVLKYKYPEIEQGIYAKARLEIYGQMLLNKHPRAVEELLRHEGLEVADEESARVLLEHWCFPGSDVSAIPDPFIYEKIVDYYHPTVVISDKWKIEDVPIIFDRLLSTGIDESDLEGGIMYKMPNLGIHLLDIVIILKYYGYDNVKFPERTDTRYSNIFTSDILTLNNDEVYLIANHTYLDADTKLSLLSKVNNLNPDLVKAILGVQTGTDIGVMGNILNRAASSTSLEQFAAVHNSQFKYANLNVMMPYIRSRVKLLANGEYVSNMFPLQLVWQYTDALGDSELYEDALINLLQGKSNNATTTTRVLSSAGKFYELLTGSIKLSSLPDVRFMSRFAC